MFKIFVVTLLLSGIAVNGKSLTTTEVDLVQVSTVPDTRNLRNTLLDFLELLDLEAMMAVVMNNMSDPEVLNFMTFVLSSEFTNVIWELESIPAFKEGITFLTSKGYEVDKLLDKLNTLLNLPPYQKPTQFMYRKGMSGFIDELINVLPLDEMKKLFKSKLESDREFAKLVETLKSQEFLDILVRLTKDEKFVAIKDTLQQHGLDLSYLYKIVKDLFQE